MRVDSVHQQISEMIAGLIHEETGLPADECELLGMGLNGMAHVAARFWLQKGRQMPREDAVRLVAQLAWRGVAGFPLIHDEDDTATDADSTSFSRHTGFSARTVTDLTETAERTSIRVDAAAAEIQPS
jgi:hypothetical protein